MKRYCSTRDPLCPENVQGGGAGGMENLAAWVRERGASVKQADEVEVGWVGASEGHCSTAEGVREGWHDIAVTAGGRWGMVDVPDQLGERPRKRGATREEVAEKGAGQRS